MTKVERLLHLGAAVLVYATMIIASLQAPSATPASIAIFVSFVETIYWGYQKMKAAWLFWAGLVVGSTVLLLYKLSFAR